jgi:hypothetical protein
MRDIPETTALACDYYWRLRLVRELAFSLREGRERREILEITENLSHIASKTLNPDTRYVVVYSMGGWANLSWHETLAMTREEAMHALATERRLGRMAYMQPLEDFRRTGLPIDEVKEEV